MTQYIHVEPIHREPALIQQKQYDSTGRPTNRSRVSCHKYNNDEDNDDNDDDYGAYDDGSNDDDVAVMTTMKTTTMTMLM